MLAWRGTLRGISTTGMPVDLRDFVDQRTKKGGFSTPTEYVRHLIREDQQREAERRIEELFAEGVRSGRARGNVGELFKQLHKLVDDRTEKKPVKTRAASQCYA
jgi:antitoxin ParD1/3/4